MSNMTNALESALSAAALRGQTYTGGRLYVGLLQGDPTDAGTFGTPFGTGSPIEGGYTSYARVSLRSDVQVNTDQFTVNDGTGMAQNSQTITFPTSTGVSSVFTHWGIFDASTAGNMLFRGALATSKTIDPADTPSFAPGAFKITWD